MADGRPMSNPGAAGRQPEGDRKATNPHRPKPAFRVARLKERLRDGALRHGEATSLARKWGVTQEQIVKDEVKARAALAVEASPEVVKLRAGALLDRAEERAHRIEDDAKAVAALTRIVTVRLQLHGIGKLAAPDAAPAAPSTPTTVAEQIAAAERSAARRPSLPPASTP